MLLLLRVSQGTPPLLGSVMGSLVAQPAPNHCACGAALSWDNQLRNLPHVQECCCVPIRRVLAIEMHHVFSEVPQFRSLRPLPKPDQETNETAIG